jgi:hypothetical protein
MAGKWLEAASAPIRIPTITLPIKAFANRHATKTSIQQGNNMLTIHAYAAKAPKGPMQPFEFEAASLARTRWKSKSQMRNLPFRSFHARQRMGMSQFPFVPGHEVVGTCESGLLCLSPTTHKMKNRKDE